MQYELPDSGFNPYFSGCFSLSFITCAAIQDNINMFQSLFFWMLLSKTSTGLMGLQRHSVWFQSLFFWMLLSK